MNLISPLENKPSVVLSGRNFPAHKGRPNGEDPRKCNDFLWVCFIGGFMEDFKTLFGRKHATLTLCWILSLGCFAELHEWFSPCHRDKISTITGIDGTPLLTISTSVYLSPKKVPLWEMAAVYSYVLGNMGPLTPSKSWDVPPGLSIWVLRITRKLHSIVARCWAHQININEVVKYWPCSSS